MVVVSFEHLQKLCIFAKFGRCSSKIEHFNFELAKGMAALFFVPDPPNFGQTYIFYK